MILTSILLGIVEFVASGSFVRYVSDENIGLEIYRLAQIGFVYGLVMGLPIQAFSLHRRKTQDYTMGDISGSGCLIQFFFFALFGLFFRSILDNLSAFDEIISFSEMITVYLIPLVFVGPFVMVIWGIFDLALRALNIYPSYPSGILGAVILLVFGASNVIAAYLQNLQFEIVSKVLIKVND